MSTNALIADPATIDIRNMHQGRRERPTPIFEAPEVAPQKPQNALAQIAFELEGKKRPNQPDMAVQNMLAQAAGQVLGDGSRVVVYSGKEDPGNQHGSNRHRTGLAADVRVYDPQGGLLRLEDPRAKEFALAAANLGARGIGAGAEYMGDAFHIDMVPHSQYGPNQGPVWGSWGDAIESELIAAMGL